MPFVKITENRSEYYEGNLNYSYGKNVYEKKEFSKTIKYLADMIGGVNNQIYDMAIVNFYYGNFLLNFHDDTEKMIKENTSISTISFGSDAILTIKDKESSLITNIRIPGNSLYIMEGSFQKHYLHKIEGSGCRVSVTLRSSTDSPVTMSRWEYTEVGSAIQSIEQVLTPSDLAEKMVSELSISNTIVDAGYGSGIFGDLIKQKNECYLIGIDKIPYENNNYDEVVIDDIRNVHLNIKFNGISNPPFGFGDTHINEEFIRFFVRHKCDQFVMLHSVGSIDYVQNLCKEYGYFTKIAHVASFPLWRQFAHHRYPVIGLGVYVCVHSKDNLDNQVLYSMIEKRNFRKALPAFEDYPDINLKNVDLTQLLSHHKMIAQEFENRGFEKPISFIANSMGFKYEMKGNTVGNPGNKIAKGLFTSEEKLKRFNKRNYTFAEAQREFLPVQEEINGVPIVPGKFISFGKFSRYRRFEGKEALKKKEINYFIEIETQKAHQDQELFERLQKISPSMADMVGKDNFTNKECVTLNIKSLTQYGSTLKGLDYHLNQLDIEGLNFAFYAMARLYQHELKEVHILDDAYLELINQSSPGFPYNALGAVKNIDVAKLILDTFQEMDAFNKEKKLMYIVYNAFTKLDLMNKKKKKVTRIISSSPAHYSLATQRFCKVFEKALIDNHCRNGARVGVGRFYQEFESIYHYLNSLKGPLLFSEIDLSGWDLRIFAFLLEVFWKFLFDCTSFCHMDKENMSKFVQVVEGHVSSFFITREGEFVSILNGQKSGHQTTCLSNTMIHIYIGLYIFFIFCKQKLEIVSFAEVFKIYFENVRNVQLGDDKCEAVTELIHEAGYNQEFILNIYQEHFSLLARPAKNKFGRTSLLTDIYFLGSRFFQTEEGRIVPVPERSRVLDGVVFFRDSNKITAKIFNFVKEKTVVHELFRLVRIQAALINGFFDDELRNVLLKLRAISVEKLGIGEMFLSDSVEKIFNFQKDLNLVVKQLGTDREKYVGIFYWLLNHTISETKIMTKVWTPLSIYSMYTQLVKPHNFRSDNSIKIYLEQQLACLKNKDVILYLSPFPSGKKSWMLHVIMNILEIKHDVNENVIRISDFNQILQSYDYIVLGENNLDNIISFSVDMSLNVDQFESIRFPLVFFFYSEIIDLIRIFGNPIHKLSLIDFVHGQFGEAITIFGNENVQMRPNFSYPKVENYGSIKTAKAMLIINYDNEISEEDFKRFLETGYREKYILYINFEGNLAFNENKRFVKRELNLYKYDISGDSISFEIKHYFNLIGEEVPFKTTKMRKVNSGILSREIGKPVRRVLCKITDVHNHKLPVDEFFNTYKEGCGASSLLGSVGLDKQLIGILNSSNFYENFIKGEFKREEIYRGYLIPYNYSYGDQLRKVLSSTLSIVEGPPGSGKTTFLVQVIKALWKEEQILVLASSNMSLKNIADKLDKEKILHNRNRSRDADPKMARFERRQRQSVLLTTPAQLINTPRLGITTVIVDEAGLMDLVNLGVIGVLKFTRFVAVGDKQQRKPYSHEFVKDNFLSNSIYDVYSVDIFLREIYRLPKIFTDFISRNFYDNSLKCMNFVSGFVEEIVHNFPATLKGESLYNEHTWKLYKKADVILTPYTAQREFLKEKGYPAETIDAYQGCETDVVLLDFTSESRMQFLLDRRRVNVAFSRCKKGMIIVWHTDVQLQFKSTYGWLRPF